MIFLLLVATSQVKAQSVDVVIRENGTERKESIDLPKSMTYPLDSLLNDWKAKNYIDLGKDCSTAEINPLFSDSVYIDRLSRIPAVMEMPYNDIIRKFIDMYAGRLRNQVSFMLSACNFYMPIFEEALDAYGLPLELRYLPIIESALNPSAVSRAGASGLWQFMIGTGKIYGLESNSLVDERRDPIKATWAAARYLKEMYDIYGDWNLVIAAYNCGPGTINKAIRRANGETDYWKIYNYLPKETRGYVPAFIAANYVIEQGGGQVVVADGEIIEFLPLPVGGIVSDAEPEEIAAMEKKIDEAARDLGSDLPNPMMYMFFLPITAIPDYAITDVGPVDYVNLRTFEPVLNVREK